jgi:hypothetical protein
VEHLEDNIQALKIRLTDEQVDIIPFDLGFPYDLTGVDPALSGRGVMHEGQVKLASVRSQKAIGYE